MSLSRTLLICGVALLVAALDAAPGFAQAPEPIPDAPNAKPPGAARAQEIVKLPGILSHLAVGGRGKYVIVTLKEQKEVVVVDVAAKKIVNTIKTEDDHSLIAAGATSFVVLQNSSGVITRYKLDTCEEELTARLETCAAMTMGSASEGPILATRANSNDRRPIFLSLKTLQNMDLGHYASGLETKKLVASASGKVFGMWTNSRSPFNVVDLENRATKQTISDEYRGPVSFSADGTVVYSRQGVYSSGLTRLTDVDPLQRNFFVPAATGPYYLSLSLPLAFSPGAVRTVAFATLRAQSDRSALLAVRDVSWPELPADENAEVPLELEHRVLLLPEVTSLVTIPLSFDQLIVHRFDPESELAASEIDYLYVASVAPVRFRPGDRLAYQIDVKSKHGGLNFHLDSGPVGMTVLDEGLLVWEPDVKFSGDTAQAVVRITDKTGQRISHGLKLERAEEPRVVAAAPPVLPRVPRPDLAARLPAPPPAVVRPNAPKHPAFEKLDDRRYAFSTNGFHKPALVATEKSGIGAIQHGRKLYFLSPGGELEDPVVDLPDQYAALAIRSETILAISATDSRFDVLDRTGKVLRSVKTPAPPKSVILHPTKPISYVGTYRATTEITSHFVVVDEEKGVLSEDQRYIGQTLVLDRTGRFLVSAYTHTVQTGSKVVRVPGPTYAAPAPRPYGGYGPRPGVPQPNPYGDRFYIKTEFKSGTLAFVYDLDDAASPEIYRVFPLAAVEANQLRLSRDGRRVVVEPSDCTLNSFAGFDPLDPEHEPIKYGVPGLPMLRGADLAHHPSLPFTLIAGDGVVYLYNTDSGAHIPRNLPVVPDFNGNVLSQVAFSGDGRQLLVMSIDPPDARVLVTRVPLPWTDEELKESRMFEAEANRPPLRATIPLAQLTGLRGGVTKPMRTAEIAAANSGSVVVVRSGPSSGTGFVVGSSGVILTCAHCISPLSTTEVAYQPPGEAEKKSARATIVLRDSKLDLAILQIKVDQPLPAVLLADPIDVNNGDDVTVIANPGLGKEILDNTITTGVVSMRRRAIDGNDYIQSSAAVNPGSSGGPMFDNQGRVVGVVVLKAGIDGVGFAVPPTTFVPFLLKAMKRDGEHGQIVRTWLDATGSRGFEGRLLAVKDGNVTLVSPAGGEPKTRPFTIFSHGDQKLLEILGAQE